MDIKPIKPIKPKIETDFKVKSEPNDDVNRGMKIIDNMNIPKLKIISHKPHQNIDFVQECYSQITDQKQPLCIRLNL